MIRPKSIQQRLTIYMFLPVTLLLIAMGIVGYSYARKSLFNEWRETAILMLIDPSNRQLEWVRVGHDRPLFTTLRRVHSTS